MEREWKEGKERKRKEREGSGIWGEFVSLALGGIDAPGNGESCS